MSATLIFTIALAFITLIYAGLLFFLYQTNDALVYAVLERTLFVRDHHKARNDKTRSNNNNGWDNIN